MSQRQEFVQLALQEDANIQQLCRGFGIARKTAYKWLARARAAQQRDEPLASALVDRSRRPLHSPKRTPQDVAAAVVEVRTQHPCWGGRKIAARLQALGQLPQQVPSAATITAILHRHSLIEPAAAIKHQAFIRFEQEAPNDVWQMDFKGDFALLDAAGARCYPLTVLDDYSRYSLGLQACANQQRTTVQPHLQQLFEHFGLPWGMSMDNGSPWGAGGVAGSRYTRLSAWLMRVGIRVGYSRPYHPQTQGKDERFHRTLRAEVLLRYGHEWRDLAACQRRFDEWRIIYNTQRPHEALAMATPASRYRRSTREFPAVLPAVESYYAPADCLRRVQGKGEISFQGYHVIVGHAFAGHPVALRPTAEAAVWQIYFCAQKVAVCDLRLAPKISSRDT